MSVCIPSYNHAPYLPAAIESVLRQSFRDFEIVIVDDGSTDNSLEIAESYAARNPSQIRVFTHPGRRNLGISATVNLAYQKTLGMYWSGLPSDDLLRPDQLKRQVALLDAREDIGWVYSYADCIDEEGNPIPRRRMFGQDITRTKNPLQRLIRNNVIPGMTVMMRRSCTEKVGLHELGLIYSDWEFWLRMAAQCKVAFQPHRLVLYRVHSYNTSEHVDPHENARRGLAVMASFKNKLESANYALADSRTRSLIELQLSYHFYCLGEKDQAQQSLHAAFDQDATLAKDTKFFATWLRDKVFELHHTFVKGSAESRFALWLQESLDGLGLASLAERAGAAHFAKLAFEHYDAGLRTSRPMAIKCLGKDSSWFLNPSLRTVLLEGLLGANVAGRMRRLKSIYKTDASL